MQLYALTQTTAATQQVFKQTIIINT